MGGGPAILVATSRCDGLRARDPSNGAVTRMLAWQRLLPAMRFVGLPRAASGTAEAGPCIVDLTGEKLPACARAWRDWRRHDPVCFLQDSQVRYHLTGLAAASGWRPRLRFAIDALRGLVREAFCYLAFRRIGYVSRSDFLLPWKSHEIRALGSTLDAARPNLPDGFRIRYLRMIGNFGYGPNRDGVRRILGSPQILSVLRRHGVKAILSGSGADALAASLPADRVERGLSGPFDSLGDLHRPDQILICPALYGSGVKNKIVEGQMIGSFTLAWRGFAAEFPYSPDWTDFFDDLPDLAAYLDFLCARTASGDVPASFFHLAEEYRLHRYLRGPAPALQTERARP